MYLMVDNYDSFTAMLASYFTELGADVLTLRNDDVSAASMQELNEENNLEGVIISPGPKNPDDCGNCKEIIRWAASKHVPLLGVCLGHQVLASLYGARVSRGSRPMHGKVSLLHTNGMGLFSGLPREFPVTRYHSLVVQEGSLPSVLKVDARTDDGAVMAIRHEDLPLFGVQFHPEAARTRYGHELISNFMEVCAHEHV
ncbi:MAG: anthranilate synthase component II [Coriobacteriales bacterium]|jgi:anthranilate synthase/aminodeoxychorismate synthase-like glutamine amidotransferase